MQSRIYFINDKTADDYDRSTSLEVIEDICAASRNFFVAGRPANHPGFRTARIARASDARLTIDDIEAWDDLVVNHVLPDIDLEIEMIGIERYDPVGTMAKQMIGVCNDRKALIERKHGTFMEAYRESAAATYRR
jgi:hypothetical protein